MWWPRWSPVAVLLSPIASGLGALGGGGGATDETVLNSRARWLERSRPYLLPTRIARHRESGDGASDGGLGVPATAASTRESALRRNVGTETVTVGGSSGGQSPRITNALAATGRPPPSHRRRWDHASRPAMVWPLTSSNQRVWCTPRSIKRPSSASGSGDRARRGRRARTLETLRNPRRRSQASVCFRPHRRWR